MLQGASNPPQLSVRDVVNAADRSAGKVTPGEFVLLFPSNAGPAALAGSYLASDGKAMTVLGDTRVLFDGIAAPLGFSISGQVGAVVPYEIADRQTTDVVVEYQGVRSSAVTLPVVASAPALFTLDLSGKGQAAMLNETGCCNSPRNPATRGKIAILYATGEGQTTPLGVSGKVSFYPRIADYPVPQLPVHVTVGGEPAEIVYAGEAPHAVAGMLQVNFRVPERAPLGEAVPLVLTVGNSRSQDGITMAVRSSVQSVLVMDRPGVTRNWIGRVLRRAGYEVLTARNSVEALRQAQEHPVDLIVLNLAIPEGESLKSVHAIRTVQPRLRIIAIDRALGPAALRKADVLDAQAVLTGSLASTAVLRRVREILKEHP
jgi:uncharacterized protein (TIGR03437 family)